MTDPIRIGAVLYDPKVASIWGAIAEFFDSQGVPCDVSFYSTYELQVDALMNGQIDVAWNSPLAHLDTVRRTAGTCRAIAMRDTDRDRVSHIVVRTGEIDSIENLRGKTIAFGAMDSPQATLIPIDFLRKHGLEPDRDFEVRRFDVLVGKHGDHVGGELDAFHCLESRQAAASTMLDLNWERWTGDGTVSPSTFRVLATTDRFDHCVFDVRNDFPAGVERAWVDVLLAMDYDNPEHRRVMDMEGLTKWLPGRTSGFGPLGDAVAYSGYFDREASS